MRNITSKTDDVGDTLPASDFNANLRVELQSVVTDAGFTLDAEGGPDSDLDMFGKSLTVYANASQYYEDTGSANTYEINRVGNLQPLEQLIDGVTVRFKAANTSTGACTLNVDGMGAKDLVDNSGSALTGGEIVAGQYIQAIYNASSDDFELISYSLNNWINLGDDFFPIVSGTGTLGRATNLIEGAYFGDNDHIYLGASQDLDIYFNGTVGIIEADSELRLIVTTTNRIGFWTDSIERWSVNYVGILSPVLDAAYSIGSPNYGVLHIYQSDNCYHYLGSDQDMYLYHNGTIGTFRNDTGSLYLWVNSSSFLYFVTNATIRWEISSAGHLLPQSPSTYNIGQSSTRVNNIYCYSIDVETGASGTIDTTSSQTITVVDGIITAIV